MAKHKEVFKDIPSYEGRYRVSDMGRVLSINPRRRPIIMKPGCDAEGYPMVNLGWKNRYRQVYVHQLVAEAFVPNPDHKPLIVHLDNDPANNAASNLAWMTSKESRNHGTRNERGHEWLKDKDLVETASLITSFKLKGKKKTNLRELFWGKTSDQIEDLMSKMDWLTFRQKYYIREKYCRHGVVMPHKMGVKSEWDEKVKGKTIAEITAMIQATNYSPSHKRVLLIRYANRPTNIHNSWAAAFKGKTKDEIADIIDKSGLTAAYKSNLRRRYLRDGKVMTQEQKQELARKIGERSRGNTYAKGRRSAKKTK